MLEKISKPHRMNLEQLVSTQLAIKNYHPIFEQISDGGVSSYRFAALSSNERIDKNIFRAIKSHAPDGLWDVNGVTAGI